MAASIIKPPTGNVIRSLRGDNDYFTRRSMDVFISKLRKYLQHDPVIKITNPVLQRWFCGLFIYLKIY